MKRTTRTMPSEQRAKISATLKGRKLSDSTRQLISKKLKEYWNTIPYENNEENTN